jgi:hypothetical protein
MEKYKWKSINSINCAFLLHSCDRYQLLFEGFEYFFHKNIPYQSSFNYYFGTEEILTDFPNWISLRSNKGEWSNRLKKLLESIPEDYIIYFQEDMWLSKPVSSHWLESFMVWVQKNKPLQVKLHSSDVYKVLPTDEEIQGLMVGILDNKDSKYLMSHQVTLLNREYLISLLPNGEHPWRNERKGTKRLKKVNPKIYHIDLFSENGHAPINENSDKSIISAYQTVSVNGTLNEKTPQFIKELSLIEEKKSYAEKLQYNYIHRLTHDGKEKPLKQDIFKKTKEWFKSFLSKK